MKMRSGVGCQCLSDEDGIQTPFFIVRAAPGLQINFSGTAGMPRFLFGDAYQV